MNITQNHIAEFSALIASIIYFNSIKYSKIKHISYFLLFILLIELLGNYLNSDMAANNAWYNCTIIIEYLFYFYLFYSHGKTLLSYSALLSAGLFSIVATVYFVIRPLSIFHSYALLVGQGGVIICTCIFIYEQFESSKEDSLLHNYFFWIVSGLFLFNLGEFVYFWFYPVIKANQWDKFNILFKAVNRNLILLLNLTYIISFAVQKKYNSINA